MSRHSKAADTIGTPPINIPSNKGSKMGGGVPELEEAPPRSIDGGLHPERSIRKDKKGVRKEIRLRAEKKLSIFKALEIVQKERQTLVQNRRFASDVRHLFVSDMGPTPQASAQMTINGLRRM